MVVFEWMTLIHIQVVLNFNLIPETGYPLCYFVALPSENNRTGRSFNPAIRLYILVAA